MRRNRCAAKCSHGHPLSRRAFEDPSGGLIAQFEWGANNPVENVRACLEAWDAPLEQLPASG